MPNEIKTAERVMESNPDSALHILQKMQPFQSLTEADRALFGILLFQALDKSNKTLQPDSVITFSVNYYLHSTDKLHLAIAYYYKARLYKRAQRFDDATGFYLKALDLIQNSQNFHWFGKIYSDMGDICSFQSDYNEALIKYQKASEFFKYANDTIEASYKFLDIGRMYCYLKDNRMAQQFYTKALKQSSDSLLQGSSYQELGIFYYKKHQFDSAQLFLRKSLNYPYKGTGYAIRFINLAEISFDKQHYDSAFQYASQALKYTNTFYIQRDCYRILANFEYSMGDVKKMALYMAKYQDCTDSVRKIEIQTKSSVLEDIHETNGAFSKSRQFLRILIYLIPVLILFSLLIVYRLRVRAKRKEMELEQAEVKLTEKQVLLRDSIVLKIEENKVLQTQNTGKLSQNQREKIYKDIYTVCLHLNDWDAFKHQMNKTFNNIIDVLEKDFPELNHKELILCCLLLLDIPTQDMLLILECQLTSFYKMKQRVAQKMKLKTTKEFEQVLQALAEVN